MVFIVKSLIFIRIFNGILAVLPVYFSPHWVEKLLGECWLEILFENIHGISGGIVEKKSEENSDWIKEIHSMRYTLRIFSWNFWWNPWRLRGIRSLVRGGVFVAILLCSFLEIILSRSSNRLGADHHCQHHRRLHIREHKYDLYNGRLEPLLTFSRALNLKIRQQMRLIWIICCKWANRG